MNRYRHDDLEVGLSGIEIRAKPTFFSDWAHKRPLSLMHTCEPYRILKGSASTNVFFARYKFTGKPDFVASFQKYEY